MAAAESNLEAVLANLPRVYVFRVPTAKDSSGYRANDWNNNSVWNGKLRVVERQGACMVLLENDNGSLYVQVPYSQPADVQPCLDSSRYFVVRVARGQQNVIVGIGFEERADAFKFKSALQEWEHRRDAQTKAQTFFDEMPAQGDLQLQEGQTIRIDLAGKVKSKAGGEASVAGGGGIGVPSGAVGLGMPAPPPVKAAAPKKKKKKDGAPALEGWVTFD